MVISRALAHVCTARLCASNGRNGSIHNPNTVNPTVKAACRILDEAGELFTYGAHVGADGI